MTNSTTFEPTDLDYGPSRAQIIQFLTMLFLLGTWTLSFMLMNIIVMSAFHWACPRMLTI